MNSEQSFGTRINADFRGLLVLSICVLRFSSA